MKKYFTISALLFSGFIHGSEPKAKINNIKRILYLASEDGKLTVAYHYGHHVDIFSAVKKGDMKLIQDLEKENPDVKNARDEYGNSPLHWAVKYNFIELVQWLLDRGANSNAKNRWSQTPLFFADWNTEAKVAQALLDKGADPNVRDRNGFAPWDFTFWKSHTRTSRRLLGKSACILEFK